MNNNNAQGREFDKPNVNPQRGGDSDGQPTETRELAREFRVAEKWVIATNIVLAIVGIIALSIYGGQLSVMRGQLKQAEAAAKQSRIDNAAAISAQQEIAQQALTASQKNFEQSVSSAHEQLMLDERAWVGATRSEVDLQVGKPIIYRMEIKNIGRTPALRVQATTTAGETSALAALPSRFAWKPNQEQLLQPEQENDLTDDYHIPVSQAAFDDIKSERKVLWFRTEIRYFDIFGKMHHTVTCGTTNTADMKSLRACPPGHQYAD